MYPYRHIFHIYFGPKVPVISYGDELFPKTEKPGAGSGSGVTDQKHQSRIKKIKP